MLRICRGLIAMDLFPVFPRKFLLVRLLLAPADIAASVAVMLNNCFFYKYLGNKVVRIDQALSQVKADSAGGGVERAAGTRQG